MAPRSAFLDRLAALPALRHCSTRRLVQVARLVDEIAVGPGTALSTAPGQVVLALDPTRVLVVDRRAVPALRELAPDLLGPVPVHRPRHERLPLVPSWSPSSV
jgi:hypothetical protein